MKTIALLKRDLWLGIVKKWYRYILVIIVMAVGCTRTHEIIEELKANDITIVGTNVWDYFFANVKGMEPYVWGPKNHFSLPLMWLCVQLCFHYIIAYYPEQDFRLYGKQILSRSKSRIGYWISKCMWCVVATFVYYIVMIGTTIITVFYLEGNASLKYGGNTSKLVIAFRMRNTDFNELIVAAVVLPFVMTLAIGVFQLLLSLVIDPIISYAIVCSIYIISVFFCNTWIPGSYTMLLRNDSIFPGSLSATNGFFLAAVLIILSVFWGCYWICNKDILE